MPPELTPVPEQERWFTDEVQPHEPALRAYIKSSFPVVRDVDDVVQESYIRILHERSDRSVRFVKAFLFKVARHLAIDLVRRSKISPVEAVGDLDGLNVIHSNSGVGDIITMREGTRMLAEAIDSLPPRCREIVILRKLQLLSQKEVAARLNLSEKSVESQLSRGIKRCEEYLRKRGMHHYYTDESR